jgi:hypothetical protein
MCLEVNDAFVAKKKKKMLMMKIMIYLKSIILYSVEYMH